ncbi:MAG: pyridoxamine 5'-phosphate oxidase family protein [Desulfarculus sp.]|nr:pyridoxamine 5'-phosphate oxidase family protein [Desulfarculus sp.]
MDDLRAKILDVFNPAAIAALATLTERGLPWVRLVVVGAAPDLTLGFVTSLGSRKVAQMRANPEVHLTAGGGTLEQMGRPYVQVEGRAAVLTDPAVKRAHWRDELTAYFSGPDDPDYAVVAIKPRRIEYWTFDAMTPQVWEAPAA